MVHVYQNTSLSFSSIKRTYFLSKKEKIEFNFVELKISNKLITALTASKSYGHTSFLAESSSTNQPAFLGVTANSLQHMLPNV